MYPLLQTQASQFEGIKKNLAAAKENNFDGKFLFLSSIGVKKSNWASKLLNFVKGNALFEKTRANGVRKAAGEICQAAGTSALSGWTG